MKIVRYRPEQPEVSLAEFEATMQARTTEREHAIAAFRALTAGDTATSTANPDGTTTWTFRPADDRCEPTEHPSPVLPENGRLDARLTPMFASARPATWHYTLENDDTGVTTVLTEAEFLNLCLRLCERAANADGTCTDETPHVGSALDDKKYRSVFDRVSDE